MKKLILFIVALFLPMISFAYVVDILPSETKIANNKPTSIKIKYIINVNSDCTQAKSNYGLFEFEKNGDFQYLERYNKKFKVNLIDGKAEVYENVYISLSKIKKTIQQSDTNKMAFKRYFEFEGGPDCATVYPEYSDIIKIKITTPSALPLQINKIRLYFDNNKAVTTVDKNDKLTAYAEVETMGKGLLKAHWEVDGRVFSRVYKHITNKRKVVFETPKIPPLPTFEPGTHFVRFVIDDPKPGFTEPTALYFVKSEKLTTKNITKLTPRDKSKISLDELNFSWAPITGTKIYLIEFFSLGEDKPIFSAYTKTNSYKIPKNLIGKIFEKGEYYSWKVVGYGENDSVIAESQINRFTIK